MDDWRLKRFGKCGRGESALHAVAFTARPAWENGLKNAASRLCLLALLWTLPALPGCSKGLPVTDPNVGDPARSPIEQTSPPAKENVVLIVVDTLRADRLTALRNGNPVMPKLKKYASTTWNFTNAHSQESWTRPSMASLFTSLYPEVHNVQFMDSARLPSDKGMTADILGDSLETMAEYLKSAGYRTAAVQSNWVVGALMGFAQGFDTYDFRGYPEFKGNAVTKRALELLDELESPFFLYVHYLDPHAPYNPPEPYRTRLGPLPKVSAEEAAMIRENGENLSYWWTDTLWVDGELWIYADRSNAGESVSDMASAVTAYEEALYDGEARFMDDEVARLIESVKDRSSNTVIIFASDHGEEFLEHRMHGHTHSAYEELTHVPLMFDFPGADPRSVTRPAQLIDVLPTLSSRLGLPVRQQWQGHDLIAMALDEGYAELPVFMQAKASIRAFGIDFQAVILGSQKLIVEPGSKRVELYDLAADPKETVNLFVKFPQRAEALKRLLADHRSRNLAISYPPVTVFLDGMDPVVNDLLKSLGYL